MKYLKETIIGLLVLWVAWNNILNPSEPEIVTEVKIEYDTVKVEVQVDPVIEYKDREVFVEDTTTIDELNNLIDSLQTEMNNNVDSTGELGEFVATAEETIKDTTGNTIGTISLTAVSRIPLDPELQFIIGASMINKNTTTTTTITKGKTFWQRFGISANISAGLGLIHKQFDVYAGVGLSFDID